MDAQMKRGLLEICVLKVLEKGDSYGYQIIKDAEEYIEISESTLYPILKPLPFLLPFMWIYKWFHVLFARPQKFKHTARNVKSLDKNKLNQTVKIKEITGIED